MNEQKTHEFLSLNPNGKIPAIIDRDGPVVRRSELFGSGTILLHLSSRTRCAQRRAAYHCFQGRTEGRRPTKLRLLEGASLWGSLSAQSGDRRRLPPKTMWSALLRQLAPLRPNLPGDLEPVHEGGGLVHYPLIAVKRAGTAITPSICLGSAPLASSSSAQQSFREIASRANWPGGRADSDGGNLEMFFS